MTRSRATIDLWKRSMPFRVVSIASLVSIVLFAMSGRSPSSTANSAHITGNNRSANNMATNSQRANVPNTSGNTTISLPSFCQSQTPAVPLTTSTNPSSNVRVAPVVSTNSGMTQDIRARFQQFISMVDAANREKRLGEKCTRMKDAIVILKPGDFGFSQCFVDDDADAKIVQARRCKEDVKSSDLRFDNLIAAVAKANADPSSAQIEALAQYKQAIMPFDESRERWSNIITERNEGEKAIAFIASSDQRIDQLLRAHEAFEKQPENPNVMQIFAESSNLQPLDVNRLDHSQRAILEQAKSTALNLQLSDARLNAVSASVLQIDARDTLVASVSALTGFDETRANTKQIADIENAKSKALDYASADLISGTKDFKFASASPDELQSLRELHDVLLRHGGILTPTVEQETALATAAKAGSLLDQSDQRIEKMHTMAVSVNSTGAVSQGKSLIEVLDSITEFDLLRFTDEDQLAHNDLTIAKEVYLATQKEELTKSVPLYIEAVSTTTYSNSSVKLFAERLRNAGFNLVSTRDESAVVLSLQIDELKTKKAKVGSLKITTADINMSLSGQWVLAGKALPSHSVKGVGRGQRYEQLAIDEAIDKLLHGFLQLTAEP